MQDAIRIYIFYELNTSQFRETLINEFRSAGHQRTIEFIDWNCFGAPPEADGDLYIYDASIISYLADNGYIRELADIVDASELFPWLRNTIKHKKKNYAFPYIVCCDTIICRQEDDLGIENIFSLPEPISAPLASTIAHYYYNIRCNRQNDDGPMEDQKWLQMKTDLELLVKKIGGKDKLKTAKLSNGFGIEEFNNKEVKYYVGFAETLQFLVPDHYIIRKAHFTDSSADNIRLMYVNVISLGSNVNADRLLDCMDIIEMMTTSDFEYMLCCPDGKPNYLLPANMKSYDKLIKADALYSQLYDIAADERNFTFRTKNYYETVANIKNELLRMLL